MDKTEITSVDDIIRVIDSKSRGRTRYEGQDPFQYWDECLVAEIRRFRRRLAALGAPEEVVNDG